MFISSSVVYVCNLYCDDLFVNVSVAQMFHTNLPPYYSGVIIQLILSRDMRFLTMWYV